MHSGSEWYPTFTEVLNLVHTVVKPDELNGMIQRLYVTCDRRADEQKRITTVYVIPKAEFVNKRKTAAALEPTEKKATDPIFVVASNSYNSL